MVLRICFIEIETKKLTASSPIMTIFIPVSIFLPIDIAEICIFEFKSTYYGIGNKISSIIYDNSLSFNLRKTCLS